MKALLRKDFYLLGAYCKSYLLICAVFFGVSLFGENNLFFLLYPAMLCSLIPVTLTTYDERSRWDGFCACLPISRDKAVSGKYLMGLLCNCAVWALTALLLLLQPRYSMDTRLLLLALAIGLSLLSPALCLPFVFRYGAEKGRIVYYVALGVFFALLYAALEILGLDATGAAPEPLDRFLPLAGGALPVCAGLYALSWRISIRIFQNKDLG